MALNLTSDLVSRNCIEYGAYLLYFLDRNNSEFAVEVYSLRKEFQTWWVYAFWVDGVSRTIFGSL